MLLRALALAGVATAASTSHAALISLGEQQFQGTGLGAVNTVLTITSPGNSTTELGEVRFNGTTAVTTGNTLAINNTPTLGTIGVTSPSDLRIVFNAQEPGVGSGNNGITLDTLVLNIFAPTGGNPLFSSSIAGAIPFTTTQTGVGNSGVVFALDATQAASAQALAAFGNANNRIGLSASASNATGGPDTFYALSFRGGPVIGGGAGGVPGAAVPEPGTVALLGLGLLGFVATRRRKA